MHVQYVLQHAGLLNRKAQLWNRELILIRNHAVFVGRVVKRNSVIDEVGHTQ